MKGKENQIARACMVPRRGATRVWRAIGSSGDSDSDMLGFLCLRKVGELTSNLKIKNGPLLVHTGRGIWFFLKTPLERNFRIQRARQPPPVKGSSSRAVARLNMRLTVAQ